MDIKVSIIIPCYNSIEYLGQCLESVTKQTLRDIEIIIVDDGSTDGSAEAADKAAAADSRIIVIHQQNSGVSAARNAALKIARGEFIGFVDSDDTISPDMYEKLFAAAKKHSAQIVCSGYHSFNSSGESSTTRPPFTPDISIDAAQIRQLASSMHRTRAFQYIWRCIFLRELINSASIEFDTSICIGEDTVFCMECYLNAERAVSIRDALYFYRHHPQSAMRKKYKPGLTDSLIRQYERKSELCNAFFPELADNYFADAARHTAECFWFILVTNIYSNDIKHKKNQLKRLCASALIRDIPKYYDIKSNRSRSLDIVALRAACCGHILIAHLLLKLAFRKK